MKVTHFQKSRCTCNNTLTFRSSELIANISDYNPKPHIKMNTPPKKIVFNSPKYNLQW